MKMVCKICKTDVFKKGGSYFHNTGFPSTNTIAREVEPKADYQKSMAKATVSKSRTITIIELPTI